MKNKLLLITLSLFLLTFSACSSTPSKTLLSSIQKPAEINFEATDFEGAGKIEMPKGGDWELKEGEYYNAKLDMTIFTQSSEGDYSDEIKESTDSLIEANKRDAPKYALIGSEEGDINSIPASRIDGKFDNGTAYVTRDYIFFTPTKLAILMARIDAKNSAMLNPIVDYIASTVKK